MVGAGSVFEDKAAALSASPAGPFEGDPADHFPGFTIGLFKVGQLAFFPSLRHFDSVVAKKGRGVKYCLHGTIILQTFKLQRFKGSTPKFGDEAVFEVLSRVSSRIGR